MKPEADYLLSGSGYSGLERKRLAPPSWEGLLTAWLPWAKIKCSHMLDHSLKVEARGKRKKKRRKKTPERTFWQKYTPSRWSCVSAWPFSTCRVAVSKRSATNIHTWLMVSFGACSPLGKTLRTHTRAQHAHTPSFDSVPTGCSCFSSLPPPHSYHPHFDSQCDYMDGSLSKSSTAHASSGNIIHWYKCRSSLLPWN